MIHQEHIWMQKKERVNPSLEEADQWQFKMESKEEAVTTSTRMEMRKRMMDLQ
jgi:hypothetical protein